MFLPYSYFSDQTKPSLSSLNTSNEIAQPRNRSLSPLNIVVRNETLIPVQRRTEPVAEVLLNHNHYTSPPHTERTITLLAHQHVGVDVGRDVIQHQRRFLASYRWRRRRSGW